MKPITILMIFIGCLAGFGCASVGSPSPTPQAKTANSSASLFQSGVSAYERKNYPVALKILTELAEQGHADAQFNLGVMYRRGEGVPKNASQAVTWYRKAAEQGYAEAQYRLGHMYDNMYENGEGDPKDALQAVTWFRKAAEQGHAYAKFSLGVMLAKTDEAILESEMSRQQIEQAQALANEWWQNW